MPVEYFRDHPDVHQPWAEWSEDQDGYYRNVAAHLTKGEKLAVTPESAARVICALHSADVSAHKGGKAIVPKFR